MSCYRLTLWVGYLPCFHLGVPLAIPLSALYLNVCCDHRAYLSGVLVDVIVKDGYGNLAWVLLLRLKDESAFAPFFTCLGRASIVGEYLDDCPCSSKFMILFVSFYSSFYRYCHLVLFAYQLV